MPVQFEAVEFVKFLSEAKDFAAQFRADFLVGIKTQNPVRFRSRNAEIFLIGKTGPFAHQHIRAHLSRESHGSIRGTGIHNDIMLAEIGAGEAATQIRLFVQRDNDRRNGQFLSCHSAPILASR